MQMALQLDREPTVEDTGFLFICVNMVGSVLGEGVELANVVIHRVIPLLQAQELLQLAAEQTRREVMTTEGGAELTPWDLMISG
jgi:hypothetical protein